MSDTFSPAPPPERPSARLEITITVVAFLALGAVAAVVLSWRPVQISYHINQLRKLRADQATGRSVDVDKLLAVDRQFQELFRLGAVRKGMTYEQATGILGKPDRELRYRDRGTRRCEWETIAGDGCYEGYIVTFGPDGGADFVPRKRKEGENPSYNYSGHGPDWLIRYPPGVDYPLY